MRLAAKPHGAFSQARVCFLRSQESVTDAGDVSIEARGCAMDGLGFGFSQIHPTSRCRAGGESTDASVLSAQPAHPLAVPLAKSSGLMS